MGDSVYSERKAVARANRGFYRAFEALDLAAMSGVWLEDERVVCVHPGWARVVGHGQVMDSWKSIFANTDAIRFELQDLDVHLEGDTAWTTSVERIEAGRGGAARSAEAVATNVFRKTTGGWKLIVHHASPVVRLGDGS